MKKILSLLLTLCLLLTLVACGGGEAANNEAAQQSALMVGFAKVDITPEDNVAMAIYGSESERISTGYLDLLYGYALAVTGSNGETVLILSCDHSWFPTVSVAEMQRKLTQEFDLAESNIVMCGTHNHSGANLDAKDTNTARYLAKFNEAMLQAARNAMADRSEAKLYAGSAYADNLNFVRRYVLKDGTYPNFESPDPELIAGHESEADNQLQVLRITREGKRDIAVYNWQAHANMNMQTPGNYNLLTADIFGPFRDEMEKALDVDCFVFNGAAGNLNPTSQIPEENRTWDHREYGKFLSKPGVEAFQNATELTGTEVHITTQSYTGTVNHEFDNVVSQAMQVLEYYNTTGDTKGAREMGKPYGINTQKHAARIVSNASQDKTRDIPMEAFAIGDMGFVCLHYEMFDSDGMYIKENSPFKQTMIVGYTHKTLGYLPSKLSEDHGGYEVDNNMFVLGTAQLLADEYLKMLGTLHK